MEDVPSIPEFYAGRDIFITGASGFMGKVLVEKLLRSCPEIRTVFILLRPKKGQSPEERILKMVALPLFDVLYRKCPTFEKKIIPIYGDVTKEDLDISEADIERLMDVSVIFHGAASVRFDDPLRDAVRMNTRGTMYVMELALKLPKIQVVVHISTTYCNSDRIVVEERLYPAHADWKKTIEIVEKTDTQTLAILCNKYIGKLPNTYTFTKSLAEHVTKDYQDRLNIVIFRPSIVISTWREPIVGWIDNFNGPVGMFIASGKGLLRSLYTNPDVIQDFMPVDVAIKGIIISAWKHGTSVSKSPEPPVYNCSSSTIKYVTMAQMVAVGLDVGWMYPLSNILWYTNATITKSKIKHYLKVLFMHLVPALLVDSILKLTGRPMMLARLQKRIYVANNALSYFMARTWYFRNPKFMALEQLLLPVDKENFTFDFRNADIYEYFCNCVAGGRRYLMKESPDTVPAAIKNLYRMWWLDRIVKAAFYCLCFYVICKLGYLDPVYNRCMQILEPLR